MKLVAVTDEVGWIRAVNNVHELLADDVVGPVSPSVTGIREDIPRQAIGRDLLCSLRV